MPGWRDQRGLWLAVMGVLLLLALFANMMAGPKPIAPGELIEALWRGGDGEIALVARGLRWPRALMERSSAWRWGWRRC